MKHLLLALMVLPLTACLKLDGNLNVKEHLVYKKGEKVELLMKGDYVATAKLTKSKVALKLKGPFATKKLTLKFPEGTVLPQDQGTFSFTAEQVGQPFAVEGELSKDVARSETVTATEFCSLGNYDFCDGGWGMDGRYRGPYSYCGSRTVRGTRQVRYHNLTTTSDFTLELVQEADVKATFNGTAVDVKKVYEFYGVCSL